MPYSSAPHVQNMIVRFGLAPFFAASAKHLAASNTRIVPAVGSPAPQHHASWWQPMMILWSGYSVPRNVAITLAVF